jgi:hypothetical protein
MPTCMILQMVCLSASTFSISPNTKTLTVTAAGTSNQIVQYSLKASSGR